MVVVGVGNPLRRDDFVGVEVVRRLRRKLPSSGEGRVKLIEAETVPESFTGPVARFRPSHVIVVDAALHGSEPGQARLVEPEAVKGPLFSTHAPSLRLFCSLVRASTGAEVVVLGIQPKDTRFGEGLSPELEEAADVVAEALARALSAVGLIPER